MYRRLLKFAVIVIATFWGLAKPDFAAAARSTESKVSPPEDVQKVMNEYLRTVQDKDSNSLEELLCFIDEDDKKLFFMNYSTKDFPEGTAIEYKKASEDCWFVVFDRGSIESSMNPFLELWKVDGKWKVLCPTPGRKKIAETKLTRAETYLYMLSEEIKMVQKESDAELQRRRDRYISELELSKRYPLAHQVYYFSGIPNEDANFLAAMPLEKFRQDVILKLDAPDGLRYKIKPSKSTFQEGEPVIVEFIIENVTDKPIKLIFRPGIQVINGSDAETARGALVFPKGQEAGENKNPYMANPDYLLKEREISIRPSETYNIEVDLLDYYNLPAAQYSIFSRIDVSKGEKDFWYGYAGTEIQVFVIPANKNTADDVEIKIKDLLSKIDKIESEHDRLIKEKSDSMSKEEKTSVAAHNMNIKSGMEEKLSSLTKETASQIAELGQSAVPVLLEELGTMSSEIYYKRWCIERSLIQIGRPAVPYLIEVLQGQGPEDKVELEKYKNTIISVLGEIRDSRAVVPLLDFFEKNKTSVIRWNGTIATALSNIGDRRAMEPLVSEFNRCLTNAERTSNWDVNSDDMLAYDGALGRLGDKRAIPVLKKALNAGPQRTKASEPQYSVAEEAARALRQLGVEVEGKEGKYQIVETPTSSEIYESKVSKILQDLYASIEKSYKDVGLTKEDVQSLLKVQAPATPIDKWKSYQESWTAIVKARDAAIEEMAYLGPGAVPVFLRAKDVSGEDRRGGDIFQFAITKIGAPAVPALIDGLSNADGAVRIRAAYSLGRIGDESAVESLIQTLSDPNNEVVTAAVWALELLKDTRATEPLLDLWNRRGTVDRRTLARALGNIGDRLAVEPLVFELDKDLTYAEGNGEWDKGFRMLTFVEALENIGDKRAIEVLKRALNAGPQKMKTGENKYLLAEGAAKALRHFGLEVVGDITKGGYQVIEKTLPDEVKNKVK